MKNVTRLLALLLVALMVLSLVPLATFAAEEPAPNEEGVEVESEAVPAPFTVTLSAVCYTKSDRKTQVGIAGTESLTHNEPLTISGETFGNYITFNKKIYEFVGVFFEGKYHSSVTVNYDIALEAVYVPHTHSYYQKHDRVTHWLQCRCGSKIQNQLHVDPATDDDSICTCGYKFSDNADLVTLWLRNMVLSPRFNKGVTEYTGQIHTYKDVTSTEVRYRTFDAKATVEVSGGTEINDGLNVFEITVTAEDRKTTKTYTVFASKPVKVDRVVITSSGSTDGNLFTHGAPKATLKRGTASLTLSGNVAKALAEQAELNGSKQIIVEPTFSKWSTKIFTISFAAEDLKAISEGCDADLVVRTFMADVVIPHAEIAALAEAGETFTVRLDKEPELTLTFLADEEVINVPDAVVVDVK